MLPRALSNREQGGRGFVWKNHIIKDTSFGKKDQVITSSAFLSNETFRPPKKTTWNDFRASIWRISWILYRWLLIWIKRCWAKVTTRRPRFWRTPAILVGDSEFSSWQWYFGSSPPKQDATVDGKNPAPIEISSLSHYLQGFMHPRWCKIFSINSIPGHHQDDMMMTLHFQARGSQPKPSCATIASCLRGVNPSEQWPRVWLFALYI